MRHSRTVLLAATAIVATGIPGWTAESTGANPPVYFKAQLASFHEVPAVSSPASGELVLRIEPADASISFILTYSGLGTVSAAHIHFGQEDVNGGIMTFLCGGGSKPPCPLGTGTVTSNIAASDITGPSAQGIAAGELAKAIAAIRAGVTYVNVHTSAFPGGEIRGQVK